MRTTLHSDTCPNLVCAVVGGIVFGFCLSIQVKHITDFNNVELTNCTIVDAVSDDGWDIHVNYTTPSTFHLAPNSTTTSSLYGMNPDDHYFVNQTLPCYASTRHLHSANLDRQSPGGADIFIIVFLSIGCLIASILLLSVVIDMVKYWRARKPPKPRSASGVSDDMELGTRASTLVGSDLEVKLDQATDK